MISSALPAVLLGGAVALPALPAESRIRLRALQRPESLTASGRWQFVLVVGAVLVFAGPGAALALALAAAVALRWRRTQQDRAATHHERHRVQESCQALSADLRAGRPAAESLASAAEVAVGAAADVLAAAAAAARFGGDVPATLRSRPASPAADVLAGLAACWEVCTQSGNGLAAAVDRVAEGARARADQHRAVEGALAGPRATAMLLAALPLAGVALAAALGADPLHTLLQTPVGLGCLALGGGLDVVGVWWTRRISRQALQG